LCPFGSCAIPPCDAFFYCGDVNASCSYNGLDITHGVAFFKGGAEPIPCPDCPPAGEATSAAKDRDADLDTYGTQSKKDEGVRSKD